ncbi:ATP-binding protein [Streptomyces sp. UH6]|uniref:SCO6881 family protein n=1 Tax=Streptomyces sp. UH6 TaxID=2748379 RepID=UPI0015D47A54|nr:ATP-binding protein [Streptomyces sp. UH6]NYV73298.1 ATP-binding protein [Streptomyces sp. UH6]
MAFCDLPVADTVCDIGDAVDFVTDPGSALGDWMAASVAEFAATAVDMVTKAVDNTTGVDLNAPWFRENYETLLPIALVALVGTFCAQLVRAAVRRDGQALRQAFTGTASGVLFAFCAIALTTVAIEVVDALSAGLMEASGTNLKSAVRRIADASQLNAHGGLGWLIVATATLWSAIGAMLYWCVMMVRKIGILVLVTLAAFAGAGGGWEAARRWRKGWIEATATLIVSKLLMTIVFVLGIAAMGRTEAKDGVSALADVLAGAVILFLVMLCPYATFKFVHWAAESTDAESLHRAGGAGAQLVKQHTERVAKKAAGAAATAGSGGAAAGATAGAGSVGSAAPQGPSPLPGDIADTPVKSGASGTASSSGTAETGGKAGSAAPASAAPGPVGGWRSTPPTTTPAVSGSGPRSAGADSASPSSPSPTGP